LELKLLNIDWKVESTKKIGEKEVPDKYTAICYYAEKQRINYPNTYTVTGYYSGTANKEYSDSKTYIVKYFKVVPEVFKAELLSIVKLLTLFHVFKQYSAIGPEKNTFTINIVNYFICVIYRIIYGIYSFNYIIFCY